MHREVAATNQTGITAPARGEHRPQGEQQTDEPARDRQSAGLRIAMTKATSTNTTLIASNDQNAGDAGPIGVIVTTKFVFLPAVVVPVKANRSPGALARETQPVCERRRQPHAVADGDRPEIASRSMTW